MGNLDLGPDVSTLGALLALRARDLVLTAGEQAGDLIQAGVAAGLKRRRWG